MSIFENETFPWYNDITVAAAKGTKSGILCCGDFETFTEEVRQLLATVAKDINQV